MKIDHFANEIRKTGFVLENNIAQILKAACWTVISNKYYVDDTEETVREIDLLAYRVTKVQHFDVYTVLIVSCKKSEENAWALLAREMNAKDPNSDWWPLHVWSNDKVIQFQLAQTDRAKKYHDAAQASGVTEALSLPDVEVFAFQEMDKKSGRPQNDMPIFNAVTSLMKAQDYEFSALAGRKKDPSIYQFNLLSIVDTDLLRLRFDGSEIKCTAVDSEHYLARYIVRKRETFSRIRFVKASSFAGKLQDYDRLHQSNCRWFSEESKSFYDGLIKDWKRIDVLIEDFKNEIHWPLAFRLERQFRRDVPIGKPSLNWDESDACLRVGFELPENVLDFMNDDDDVRKHIASALKAIYRYDGPFFITYDIPF